VASPLMSGYKNLEHFFYFTSSKEGKKKNSHKEKYF